MKTIIHSIIGSGLSALIKDQLNSNAVIFSDIKNKVMKSARFYENLNIGGNSNIWGGYINFKTYSLFLKNTKFKKYHQNQKLFKLRKLFTNKKFSNTYYISNFFNKDILRIKNDNFRNLIIPKKIEKISLLNNRIFIHTGKEKILTKKISLCVGSLSLIEILHKSKIIKSDDKISFIDGGVNYKLNFFLNFKKNYFIPMTIIEIIEKLYKGKKRGYDKEIKKTFFVQAFSNSSQKYTLTVKELLLCKSNFIRYFLTNHPTNLKINNIPINIFIKKYSNKINIYNSGTVIKYLPGPISQNLIYNAVMK